MTSSSHASGSSSSSSYNPDDGSFSASHTNHSSASSTHSQSSHSIETAHVETKNHTEAEFEHKFNYTIDLGEEKVAHKNTTVHVATNHTDTGHGTLDITVVTPSGGIDTIETSTLTPNGVPVPIPNPRDRCRADDAVRCPDSSVSICTVQQCDGNVDCPGGEDELDCPEEGILSTLFTIALLTCSLTAST